MYIFILKIKSAYRKTETDAPLTIYFYFWFLTSINIKWKEVMKKMFKKKLSMPQTHIF